MLEVKAPQENRMELLFPTKILPMQGEGRKKYLSDYSWMIVKVATKVVKSHAKASSYNDRYTKSQTANQL